VTVYLTDLLQLPTAAVSVHVPLKAPVVLALALNVPVSLVLPRLVEPRPARLRVAGWFAGKPEPLIVTTVPAGPDGGVSVTTGLQLDGTAVCVGLGVCVGVEVEVLVWVGVRVAVLVGVGVNVGVAVEELVGVKV
jgi:hypothetical protein